MAENENIVNLKLPRGFIGQLLDGLDVLIEQWDYTARYLEHGVIEQDYIIRECSNENEAKDIAEYYRSIKKEIQEQLK